MAWSLDKAGGALRVAHRILQITRADITEDVKVLHITRADRAEDTNIPQVARADIAEGAKVLQVTLSDIAENANVPQITLFVLSPTQTCHKLQWLFSQQRSWEFSISFLDR